MAALAALGALVRPRAPVPKWFPQMVPPHGSPTWQYNLIENGFSDKVGFLWGVLFPWLAALPLIYQPNVLAQASMPPRRSREVTRGHMRSREVT